MPCRVFDRRAVVGGLAGMVPAMLSALWGFSARAQPMARPPIVGFLGSGTPDAWRNWISAFVQRLHELGWVDGRTVALEFRWAEGRPERYAEIADELVRLNVDVIVTSGTSPVAAAKRATSTIPIVFATAGDPVAAGLVASLARPGGNVTGVSNQFTDLAGKRVEFLREVVPTLRRLALFGDAGNRSVALDMNAVAESARTVGIEGVKIELRSAEDIPAALSAQKGQVQALYFASGPLVDSSRARINALALAEGLPTMHGTSEQVRAGGLMSYGANRLQQFQEAAELVDKILRGAKPADLPVLQPTKFELLINLKTAKTLGLDVPAKLLALADEVIE